jgi:hypothetical protein
MNLKKYLYFLFLFIICCNANERAKEYHNEVMYLKPKDVSYIEIYENAFYETTRKAIYNKDTIEMILYNIGIAKNERPHYRTGTLCYELSINTIDKVGFIYEFWVLNTGEVYFYIEKPASGVSGQDKRNDFFKDFFYRIFKKKPPR